MVDHKMSRLTAALLLASALPLMPLQTAAAQDQAVKMDLTIPGADNALMTLIDEIQTFDDSQNPLAAAESGDTEAARKMPDASRAAELAQNAQYSDFLTRLRAMDMSALSDDARLNAMLMDFVLERRVSVASFDQSRVPFMNDSGFFTTPGYVARQTRIESMDDAENYLARLRDVPRFLSEHKDNMQRGIETGYTAPRMIMDGVIEGISALSTGVATDHPLYAPLNALPSKFSDTEKANLETEAQTIINTAVIPAFADILTFMENDYLPATRTEPGLSSVPGGSEQYEILVKNYTTLNLTPDEVHQIGLDEVARIRAEMDGVIAESGFEGTFAEFLEFLRTDDQFYAETPEQLLKEASWIAKRVDGKMPEYFGKLARLPYGVLPVPDDIAPNYTTGRYWGGDPDNHRAGNYMVNTYDLKARPLYNLPALTLHEGVPGHHHQISLTQEAEGVPEFRRSLYPHAYGEGWGLYTEKLGKEMGMYLTPYEDFGRLTYEMWRACRLVVDTGLHWKGWTRQQAENCFLENSALSRHNIRTEVDRYISWPGQALAYKIGELKIWELRALAESELGDDFNIRDFHDALLVDGAVPLSILEDRIKAWIETRKAAAE